MIPKVNPRQMQHMMRKMGVSQVDIPATEVIIKTPEIDLIIRNPQVSKVNMMGQETIQIIGQLEELTREPIKIDISEEDIETVMQQTGTTKEKAKKAIEENNGDLAAAIMAITPE
jgi:nascent polypeptide-associated complex subunit alpha